jgi:hypothetical protein
MAEEVRFFLRTALYAAVIAVIYWFASRAYEGIPLGYDWAGTTLLAFTALACAVVTGIVLLFARAARRALAVREGSWPRRVGGTANRLIGLEHRSEGGRENPLASGPELLPGASPWPIVAALGATLILLGLVYGPWLVAPGVVVVVIGAGGWLRHE